MDFEKYHKIKLLGDKDNEGILKDKDDDIIIEEKVDGGNFRFMFSKNGLVMGSRTRELDEDNKNTKAFKRCMVHIKKQIRRKKIKGQYIFYGECVSGDTIIKKTSGGPLSMYMSIKDMYKFQEKGKEIIGGYYIKKDGTKIQQKINSCWWKTDKYPCSYSLDIKNDTIKSNRIKIILFSGKKDVYEVFTRKGFRIKTTNNHKFWTPNKWKQLKNLKINDCVAIVRFDINMYKKRLLGEQHKLYYKLAKQLKKEKNCELCNTNRSLEVHHKDQNYLNNNINNLQVLCTECHKKQLNNKKKRESSKEYEFDSIKYIKHIGKEDCYDISMEGTENEMSFVGNNFILHNCMIKHTMSYDWENIPPYLGFDIKNVKTGKYIDYDEKLKMFKHLRLDVVPLIQRTKAGTIKKFTDESVPKTKYPSPDAKDLQAEGVVIKNYGKNLFAKYVREKFREKCKEVFGDSKKWARQKGDNELVIATYCTNARIDKMIFKLIDEGVKLEMKMMEQLPKRVTRDIYEEHWEEICFSNWSLNFKDIRKKITKRCLSVLQQVIVNNAL